MEIDFQVVETIRERRSVRSYDGMPVSDEMKKRIKDYAAGLENPFGVAVSFGLVDRTNDGTNEKLGTYGVIKGASTFLGAFAPDVDMAPEAIGFEMENLVLFLTSQGYGTVWLGGTLKREGFRKAMGVPEGFIMPAISPVGFAVGKRFFEKVMRKSLKADSRKPWSDLFFAGEWGSPLSEREADAYAQPLEMVRLAPSSTNGQPWRVVKIGNDFHFYADYKNDASPLVVQMKRVDMGIALCHFALTVTVDGLKGKFVVSPPSGENVPETAHYIATWVNDDQRTTV